MFLLDCFLDYISLFTEYAIYDIIKKNSSVKLKACESSHPTGPVFILLSILESEEIDDTKYILDK